MSNPKRDRRYHWNDDAHSYGMISKFLHWIVFVGVLFCYGLAWSWSMPGRGWLQGLMVDAHRFLGISILLIALLRILRRLHGRPSTYETDPKSMRVMAGSIQIMMLFILVFISVLGWGYTNAGGIDINFLGLDFPAILPKDQHLEELTVSLHELFANLFLIILGIHFIGAGRHWLQSRGLKNPDSHDRS